MISTDNFCCAFFTIRSCRNFLFLSYKAGAGLRVVEQKYLTICFNSSHNNIPMRTFESRLLFFIIIIGYSQHLTIIFLTFIYIYQKVLGLEFFKTQHFEKLNVLLRKTKTKLVKKSLENLFKLAQCSN